METHRIKVKIGSAEFEAEGPKELVTAQFDAFMAAISSMPKEAPAPPPTPALPLVTPPPGTPSGDAGGVPRAILERVFRQGDTLSLAALPSGENANSDALLALLYGYLKLSGQQTVTGTSIMKSARVSGVNFDRVDRAMAVHQPDFVLAAGVKKARRYQLNNRGIARAEEIIRAIVQ